MNYRITWRDRIAAAWRCLGGLTGVLEKVALVAALLIFAFAVVVALSGCTETRGEHSDHKTTTEKWEGTVSIPVPVTVNGATSFQPCPVPISLSRTVEEDATGTTRTQTGLDQAAIAQIGAGLATALKTAFPALSAVSAAVDTGSDWMKTLLGGSAATTAVGVGFAALRHRAANRLASDNDEAWERAKEAEKRAATAEARMAALGQYSPNQPTTAQKTITIP